MKLFHYKSNDFIHKLNNFIERRYNSNIGNNRIDLKVKRIINDIKNNGDTALFKYSKKFDGVSLNKSNLKLSNKILKSYKKDINPKILRSFKIAIKNIINFHKKQYPKNYQIKKNNLLIGSDWKPLDSVGLYIPGGSAIYPSSLIMNIVPAKVAKVKRIVVTTPSQNGKFNPYLLALLDYFNIDEIYQLGGAQAIAALAYGTKSINPVNKIFGPGNAYVSSAKKNVFGKVGVDLMAGPSEIVIVADKSNNSEWVASDLIAQAEHDEKAQSILITNDINFSKKVTYDITVLIKKLRKKNIIKKSLDNFGAIVILRDLEKSSNIINLIAPEHLHLHNKSYKKILSKVKNYGTVFIGEYSTEAFGDYIVGTNHILPTSGSAKFSSGVGVLDFMKRTSFVKMNKKSATQLEKHVSNMAEIEQLDGHKMSVKVRQNTKNKYKVD